MEVQLVSIDADVASYAFVLDGRPVTVGRSVENDVCLGDPEVSRRHCEFEQFEDLIVVSDLDSSNGTFVNGLRIKQVILKPGDKLTLGRRAFRICYDRDSTWFAAFDQASPLAEEAAGSGASGSCTEASFRDRERRPSIAVCRPM